MHKRLISLKGLFVALFTSFLVSCSSSSETPTPTGRGTIISKTLQGSFTTQALKLLLQAGGLSGFGDPKYDVDVYSVIYETIDAKGQKTQASGMFAMPKNTGKTLPLASYQHGTVLQKNDVPSRAKGSYEVGLLWAMDGYVVSMPDFLGLGDSPGLRPYIHAASEATAVVDMLRASRTLAQGFNVQLNGQVFLFGYSQGGHVTAAAHREIEAKHASEFSLTAVADLATPFDVSGVQYEALVKKATYPAPGFFPYILFAYNSVYNWYPNAETVLNTPYNSTLPKYFTPEMPFSLGQMDIDLPASKIPTDILKPDILQAILADANHPIRKSLKENDLYEWIPKAPLLICHCDGDQHVPQANSLKAEQSFKSKGATVTFVNPLAGGTHFTCALPSFAATKKWFDTLKK